MSLNSGIYVRGVSIPLATWQGASDEVTDSWCRSFSEDAASAFCCWLAVVKCEYGTVQGCTYIRLGAKML